MEWRILGASLADGVGMLADFFIGRCQ